MTLRAGVTQAANRRVFEAVCEAVRERGAEPVPLDPETLEADLAARRCDVVFPLPPAGRRWWQIWLCHRLDLLGVPYAGRDAEAQRLALDKAETGHRLREYGIPTPRRCLMVPNRSVLQRRHYPVIVKPAWEGSSHGIWPDSMASDEAEATALARRVMEELHQPAVIEQFIAGREFSVAVIAGETLPILEVDVANMRDGHPPLLSERAKREHLAPNYCPADVTPSLAERLRQTAVRAVGVLGCTGVARVDMRLDSLNRPRVLEINAMPGLDPDHSDVPRMARAAGWSYANLIWRLIEDAMAMARPREEVG